MAIQIQLRSGTTAEHSTFKGAVGEVTVDTTKNTLVVHDGVTAGGHPLMNEMSFGVGNARLNVTSSRAINVVYTNASNTLKMVSIRVFLSNDDVALLYEGATIIDYIQVISTSSKVLTLNGIILPGRTYKVTTTGTASIQQWVESI